MINTNTNGITNNANNIVNNANVINANTNSIASNANNINVLSSGVGLNSAAIANVNTRVDSNLLAIMGNVEAIEDLGAGIASAFALPDMYLNPDETYTIGGGVGFYEGETAVAAGVMIRAGENLSFGGSVAGSDGAFGGKLQARWGG